MKKIVSILTLLVITSAAFAQTAKEIQNRKLEIANLEKSGMLTKEEAKSQYQEIANLEKNGVLTKEVTQNNGDIAEVSGSISIDEFASFVQTKFGKVENGNPSKTQAEYLDKTLKNTKLSYEVRKMALYMKYGENYSEYYNEIENNNAPVNKDRK